MMNNKLAFVGGGNMARSMIGGLLANDYDPGLIRVSDPDAQQREALSRDFPVTVTEDNLTCIDAADVITTAIKPQNMKQVLISLHQYLKPSSQLLISIAAGIRTRDIIRWIDRDIPLIRVMPNTPALIGCGASVLFAGQNVQLFQKDMAQNIMQAVGEIAWVDNEDLLDAVTGISGSGPAYFFRIIEIMIKTAQKNGLDPELSKKLVLQTALGATQLARDSNLSATELRKQVTSKRGTTEAALNFMENSRVEAVFEGAISAAIARSRELASELGEK
ncbi:MAG: pyrroline-5-carboxylate reductase [Gammaproteobacteria bacterium]|nr:pyrroline-5-carboxylate reductase [Gammaproteobacteria bacterium]MCY4312427.1 pyrroline-5-carboxylate reductase [Gammaproteobacteria bacterium]